MARTRQDGPRIGPDRAGGGAVAQLGERRNRTAEVRGSNPLGSTKCKRLRLLGNRPALLIPAKSGISAVHSYATARDNRRPRFASEAASTRSRSAAPDFRS